MDKKPKLLIFDLNETLLDTAVVKNNINSLLGSASAFDYWFSKLLQYSWVETISGRYRDFGTIGEAALEMSAQKFSVSLSEDEIKSVLKLMSGLKPYPEVPLALEQLKKANYKLVVLTNGGKKTLAKQMKNSKLDILFDSWYSVETVKKFKPHPETYEHVLKQEKANANEAMLIAAHAWDITGAARAGLKTAFVQRPGKFLYPCGEKPNITGKNMDEIAKALLDKE